MYLYRHCKPFAVANPEGSNTASQAPLVGDGTQQVIQERYQKVQMILKETTRVLQETGYNPQAQVQEEHLDRFSLLRSGFLSAESNNHGGIQTSESTLPPESNTAHPANLTGTTSSGGPETFTGEPATAPIIDPSDSFEQGDRAPSKKRRRH